MALYDYDPRESSPNVDVEVAISRKSQLFKELFLFEIIKQGEQKCPGNEKILFYLHVLVYNFKETANMLNNNIMSVFLCWASLHIKADKCNRVPPWLMISGYVVRCVF